MSVTIMITQLRKQFGARFAALMSADELPGRGLPETPTRASSFASDLLAAAVVCTVAIPMCIGIAIISGATPQTGILSGIIGGLVVGSLSGSHTSITGPSAGLTFIIAGQIAALGSFETFLLAVVLAGIIQLALGLMRLGWLAWFFPSSVLQALLAAIGVLLVLKQIPHLLGHDLDPEGDMSFFQLDRRTTLSELASLFQGEVHRGAMTAGIASLALLILLRFRNRDKSPLFPDLLIVMVFGTLLSFLFRRLSDGWVIDGEHLLQLPVHSESNADSPIFRFPDWSQYRNPAVLAAAALIALTSALETLVNLSATDRIDRAGRRSPPTRELLALGTGNILAGLLGGIPMSSAIERSAVNLEAGARSKAAAILHGGLLLIAAFVIPSVLNVIPLSVLAAVLIVTGFNLARPAVFAQVWKEGRYQWFPFIITFLAIVFTNLLVGVVIGLCVAVGSILNSNLRRPIRRISEKHLSGEVLHIELANQVSFLNRPVLERTIYEAPPGCNVLLDATNTDYIDPDILAMIRQLVRKSGKSTGPRISLRGFREKYDLSDQIQFVDYTSRELQEMLTPDQVLQILREGNHRFCSNERLSRDLGRQLQATSSGQHPFAAILSCIDSRAPVETILDLGLGDVFSARVAGNVTSPKVLGSLEYATAVVGSKLILVLGHTSCGAVHASVKLADAGKPVEEATGCQHLDSILEEIRPSIDLHAYQELKSAPDDVRIRFIEDVARRNVLHSVRKIVEQSRTVQRLVEEGRVAVVGAIYNVSTGRVDFLTEDAVGLKIPDLSRADGELVARK